MNDDRRPDSENEVDDQEPQETVSGDKKKQGTSDSAAPADDDIIIK